jgi:hypothetical protein
MQMKICMRRLLHQTKVHIMRDANKPEVLVNVYGKKPPRAAEFGKGVSDIAGVQEATDAHRNAKPGEYDHKR